MIGIRPWQTSADARRARAEAPHERCRVALAALAASRDDLDHYHAARALRQASEELYRAALLIEREAARRTR